MRRIRKCTNIKPSIAAYLYRQTVIPWVGRDVAAIIVSGLCSLQFSLWEAALEETDSAAS